MATSSFDNVNQDYESESKLKCKVEEIGWRNTPIKKLLKCKIWVSNIEIWMSTAHYPLTTVNSPLCTIQHALSSMHYPVCTIQYALYSMHDPLSNIDYRQNILKHSIHSVVEWVLDLPPSRHCFPPESLPWCIKYKLEKFQYPKIHFNIPYLGCCAQMADELFVLSFV